MRKIKTESPPQRAHVGGYSVNSLAKQLNMDRRTLDKIATGLKPLRVEGRTKFFALDDVEKALKAKGRGRTLREELLTEQIRSLRRRNDLEEKKLVALSAVVASVQNWMGPVRTILQQKLINEYPSQVTGLAIEEVRKLGGTLMDTILQQFRGLARHWKC